MDLFQTSMSIINGLLRVYYFMVLTSFILSWIQSTSEGMLKFKAFIHKFTNPYMKHFRGISWLRFGMMDFSSFLGIIVLGFLLFLTQKLAKGDFPTWYAMMFWLIEIIWGFMALFILIFAILMIFRLITLYTMKDSKPDWIDSIDRFLFPLVSRFLGIFTNKTIAYPVALGIFAVTLIAFRYLAGWGLAELIAFLKVRLDELNRLRP